MFSIKAFILFALSRLSFTSLSLFSPIFTIREKERNQCFYSDINICWMKVPPWHFANQSFYLCRAEELQSYILNSLSSNQYLWIRLTWAGKKCPNQQIPLADEQNRSTIYGHLKAQVTSTPFLSGFIITHGRILQNKQLQVKKYKKKSQPTETWPDQTSR